MRRSGCPRRRRQRSAVAITGEQLVTDAMLQATILGQDQTPDAWQAALVLRRLNRLLDSWATEPQMIFSTTTDSFTMTAGTASYASTLLTTLGRSVAIESVYVSLSSIDYVVNLIDEQTWQAITYKPTTGVPTSCFADRSFPTETMYFYPTPYAAFTCYVSGNKVLTSAVTLSTSLSLPAGYERALVDNLAVDICPSFYKQATDQMISDARTSRAVLKRNNYTPLVMDTGLATNQPSPDAFIYKGF